MYVNVIDISHTKAGPLDPAVPASYRYFTLLFSLTIVLLVPLVLR
jgi:hypothetical protein